MSYIVSIKDALQKIEPFCVYQERCHQEVIIKLKSYDIPQEMVDEIIVQLINTNFLNEERFARAFARGKHNIKKWGKRRIINELKLRNISKNLIETALGEIDEETYISNFDNLAERKWEGIRESNFLKKRNKFCNYLLQHGYESELVYKKVFELENKK